ncbi:MAG: sigma-70 family RNA polymerase sigma factor [Oscillospiraceae bacterium]|nr:sigma-70 family RNA polymerase sigma factor [Oscillospiraceae bacterium]
MNEMLLLSRARGGDSAAFGELVEHYRDNVYRLAYRMCGNAHDADEAAQEAFIAAWRALPNFRGEAKFSTWLYRLTTNAAIDLMRREKRHSAADIEALPEMPDESDSLQQQVERTEQQQAVQQALSSLSEEYREILLLRYMEELDYAEIAEVLRLPSGTVKSRINRAKSALKTALLKSGNIFGGEAVIHTENNGKEV